MYMEVLGFRIYLTNKKTTTPPKRFFCSGCANPCNCVWFILCGDKNGLLSIGLRQCCAGGAVRRIQATFCSVGQFFISDSSGKLEFG